MGGVGSPYYANFIDQGGPERLRWCVPESPPTEILVSGSQDLRMLRGTQMKALPSEYRSVSEVLLISQGQGHPYLDLSLRGTEPGTTH